MMWVGEVPLYFKDSVWYQFLFCIFWKAQWRTDELMLFLHTFQKDIIIIIIIIIIIDLFKKSTLLQ